MRLRHPHGAASVEQVGLVLLIALLLVAAISAIAAGGPDEAGPRARLGARAKASLRAAAARPMLARSADRGLRSAARGPGSGARPRTGRRAGPDGSAPRAGRLSILPPTELRRAVGTGVGLTASNRRVTAFTSVEDHRRARGSVEVTYWLYRPTIGWARVVRTANSADGSPKRHPRRCSRARTRAWCPSRRSPVETTTTSRRARSHPGAGRSRASTRADTRRRRSRSQRERGPVCACPAGEDLVGVGPARSPSRRTPKPRRSEAFPTSATSRRSTGPANRIRLAWASRRLIHREIEPVLVGLTARRSLRSAMSSEALG